MEKLTVKGYQINYYDSEHSEFRMSDREISNKEVAWSLLHGIETIIDTIYGGEYRFVMVVSHSHNTSIVFEVWEDSESGEAFVRTKTRIKGISMNTLHRNETVRVVVD